MPIHRTIYPCVLAVSLSLAGCFAQASVGAQRSAPTGSWTGGAGLVLGFQVDLGDPVSIGLGGEASVSGYENDEGDGYVRSGPFAGVVRARVIDSPRRALAVVGEASLPGSVAFAADGEGSASELTGVDATRGYLGLSYERAYERGGGAVRLHAGAGANVLRIKGPDFATTTTAGPAITFGWSASAKAMGYLFDRIFADCDDLSC